MIKRKILFTGCSTGFGSYIRTQLLEQGHRVYGVGINGPDYEMDFGDDNPLEFHMVMDEALGRLDGVPDTLINNAGITRIDFAPKHDHVDFMEVLRVNLVAPFLLTQEWFRVVQERCDMQDKHDLPRLPVNYRLVNTSSMGTSIALRGSPGYCASKAGLESMTKVWAKEWAGRYPITACCIAPGGVEDTVMWQNVIKDLQRTRGMTEEEAKKYNTASPLGRNCSYDEVWKMFDFAVNNMPEYCSGTVLRMPGAMGV